MSCSVAVRLTEKKCEYISDDEKSLFSEFIRDYLFEVPFREKSEAEDFITGFMDSFRKLKTSRRINQGINNSVLNDMVEYFKKLTGSVANLPFIFTEFGKIERQSDEKSTRYKKKFSLSEKKPLAMGLYRKFRREIEDEVSSAEEFYQSCIDKINSDIKDNVFSIDLKAFFG